MTAFLLAVIGMFSSADVSTPAVSGASECRFYFDSASGTEKISCAAASYASILAAASNGFPIANVKAYGAKCDGSTDDTVAVQAALTAATFVFIPPGGCVTGTVTVVNDNTMIFGEGPASVLKFKASVSSATHVDGSTHTVSFRDVWLDGGSTSCKTGCPTNTSRDGVTLMSYKNGSMINTTISGYDYRAVYFLDATTDRLTHYEILGSSIYNSFTAVQQTLDTSEYVRIVGDDIHDNYYALVISAGNTLVSSSKINDNNVAIYLNGSASNSAHSPITGNHINHSASWSIQSVNVLNGEAFTGNTIIDGPIWLQGSQGINITSGILDVQSYCLDGGGRNNVRFNEVKTSYANTVTHSCNAHTDNTIFSGNSKFDGTFLDDNCADNAGPAACGTAPIGAFVMDTGNTTVVVSTTAVQTTSRINVMFDSSLGTELGITCNTTVALPTISARVAGASFTVTVPAAPAVNRACYTYEVSN